MTGKTVLFGNGTATGLVAAELLNKGVDLIIATQQAETGFDLDSATAASTDARIELLTRTSLKNCRRKQGMYELTFAAGEDTLSREAARIVLCDDYRRKPDFSQYGLTPCQSVISLSQLAFEAEKDTDHHHSIVFLSGIYSDSNPAVSREVMEAALRLTAHPEQKIYILTGNLKVAAHGLEALYKSAREAGVTFIKFNREKPDIRQVENGSVTITFKDEITQHLFRLSPGLTIVDEILSASETTTKTAEILSIDKDLHGFAQTDNVHRIPVLTNRKGIFVAGPSRTVLAPEQRVMDIDSVSLALTLQNAKNSVPGDVYAEIDPGQCVQCLTCYRICPYRAITIDGKRVQVEQNACEGCGICYAECPKCAIHMQGQAACTPAQQIETGEPVEDNKKSRPIIYAFCCSRSAIQAAHLASFMGLAHPEGLRMIEVPCSGMISTGCLLSAFQNGADGILVLTCHSGNCHAERGNTYAHQRTSHAADLLEQVGLEKDRLLTSTLASNMGFEFSEIVNGFADTLKQMRPLKE